MRRNASSILPAEKAHRRDGEGGAERLEFGEVDFAPTVEVGVNNVLGQMCLPGEHARC
jgi:hypothetical protein